MQVKPNKCAKLVICHPRTGSATPVRIGTTPKESPSGGVERFKDIGLCGGGLWVLHVVKQV